MKKIMESKDYGMFELLPFNRDLRIIKKLEESMKRHGWIDAYPMHVIQKGERHFLIKAGHRRFSAAKNIGIGVKFIPCDDNSAIYELEKATERWSLRDYLESHIRNGNKDYVIVKEYCEESGIGLSSAISMLGGQSAGGGNNFAQSFKSGKYQIREDCDHAYIVKDVVLFLKKSGILFYNAPLFVQAISKVVWVKEFKVEKFKNKIKLFSGAIEKKVNLEQYLDMIEDLYNRHSQSKIPLKFFAEEEAKRRQELGTKKAIKTTLLSNKKK